MHMVAYVDNDSTSLSPRLLKQHHTSKAAFALLKNPIINRWAATITNPTTRIQYVYRLGLILKQLRQTPEQFLDTLKTKPDEVGIALDSLLPTLRSQTGAVISTAAILKFAKFHRVKDFQLMVEIRPKRKRKKGPFTWEQAETVINASPEPYRQIFNMMRYGGLDQNQFTRLNWNEPIDPEKPKETPIEQIKAQMQNSKGYIRIDLPPRKSNLDTFFVLIPKVFMADLPMRTRKYTGRGDQLVTAPDLESVWRRAAKRVGLWHPGLGCHHLRVAFRSRCGELGIPEVAEWQMGRGGDPYGYDRSGIDETFILEGPEEDGKKKGGLKRLWESAPLVDRQTIQRELEARDARIRELERKLNEPRPIDQRLVNAVFEEIKKNPNLFLKAMGVSPNKQEESHS